jgi:hypothetical protein
MIQIDRLTSDLPADRKLQIRYEDLCEQPARELSRICAVLGLEYSPTMLQRPTGTLHHLGGSPSKFDPNRIAIARDRNHEGAFDAEALARMRQLVGDVADTWGY